MLTMTPMIANAAAHDAGNRHMREHGRTKWNKEDWNAACAEYDRLMPIGHELTLDEHAEAWARENGKDVPTDRNSVEWRHMYEEWIDYAFADFKTFKED